MPEGMPGGPWPPQLGHETWLARLSAPIGGPNRKVIGEYVVEKSALVAGWFQQPAEDPFAVLAELLKTIRWLDHAEDISYEF